MQLHLNLNIFTDRFFFFLFFPIHFEMKFWYVLADRKGIQYVFVSAVVSILIFLGQTVSHIMVVHLKEHTQRSPD